MITTDQQSAISAALKRRQAGQPPTVIPPAWKAQHRLHQRYTHLAYRKPPQIAAVEVGRELVGFLWAAMIDCGPEGGDVGPIRAVLRFRWSLLHGRPNG